jgi:Polyketide cyclase / dehydrase and lipid transport
MRGLLRADTTVRVGADELWDLLVDWPRQGEWIPFTRVRTIGGDGRDVGGRIEAWTGVGRLGFHDPMVITSWERPRRCEVLHTGRWVRGEAGFDVTPAGADAASVTWWESLEIPLGQVGAVGWRLSRPLWRVVLRDSLRRLRDLAETTRAG